MNFQRLLGVGKIVPWEADGRTWAFTYVGQQAERMLGFPLEQWRRPGFWVDHLHPEDRGRIVEACERQCKAGEDFELEYRMVSADGTAVWVHDYVSVEMADGQPGRLRGVFVDITNHVQAAMEQDQQRWALVLSSRVATLGQLAGALTHELSQPLAAIRSNAEAAQNFLNGGVSLAGEVGDILSDIVDDSRRAGDVLDRLRAMMNKGAPQAFRALQLDAVARKVAEIMRAAVADQGATLRITGAASAIGDEILVQQVLINLVVNALQAASTTGGGCVQIDIRIGEPDRGVVRVEVCDDGPGIDEEDLSRVFEMFYSTKPTGMGLGLGICKGLVEAQGGRIWATSEAERGATVGFELPCAEEAA